MGRAAIIGAILVAVTATARAVSVLTSSSVERDVAQHGAKKAVDRLRQAGTWDRVEDRIASGSPSWIRLAPALSEGTDAGTSEGLGISLMRALPKAPAAVLAEIDPSGSSVPRAPLAVCSASFYEGDPTDVPRYRASAIAAVSRVHDPALARARDACLMRLQASGR